MIQVLPNSPPWFFWAIYVSTNTYKRLTLWDNLINYSKSTNGAWLVAGDFNEVLTHHDKQGGTKINNHHTTRFWSCINSFNLIDLGFKSRRFTRSNLRKKRNGPDLILECLDRALATQQWLNLFPNAKVIHFTKTHSDHTAKLINITASTRPKSLRPFRIEKFWVNHPNFKSIVEHCWSSNNNNLLQASYDFHTTATNWSNSTFGDIFKTKKETACSTKRTLIRSGGQMISSSLHAARNLTSYSYKWVRVSHNIPHFHSQSRSTRLSFKSISKIKNNRGSSLPRMHIKFQRTRS